jgi:hypothetical protein
MALALVARAVRRRARLYRRAGEEELESTTTTL